MKSHEDYPDHFLNVFGVTDMEPAHMAVSMMYFSFTSLSTVGFGDYYPVSNIERVTGTIILLFGVACFSYIMGELINAINEHKAYYEEHDEIDTTLSQFFGILKKFNHNEDLESKF
jgi:voltage-gated potassium channel